ncbi:MAG: site-specific integrase [Calditrichaeota bacterium]|jgi:integrase|nr:site-specific integrase [Calditrichota bacterium]
MAYLIHDKISKRQPSWTIRFRNPKNAGRYASLSLHCERSEANETLKKYNSVEGMDFEHSIGSVTPLASGLIDRFMDMKRSELSPNALDAYKYMLAHFSSSFIDRELWSITPLEFEEWQKRELSSCKTTSTYNSVMRHTRAFLSWAEKDDHIAIAPILKSVDEKPELQRGEWLEEDQINAILEAATPDMRDYYTVLLITGARAREILQKPWAYLHDNYIEVQGRGKANARPERLWLNKEAKSILARRKLNEERMFDFSYYTVRGSFRRIRESTGIQFTPHDLRRTCGYRLIRAGVDLSHVSKYLRHSSLETTVEQYQSILKVDYQHLANLLTK